jgi:hypothetical protein
VSSVGHSGQCRAEGAVRSTMGNLEHSGQSRSQWEVGSTVVNL